MLTENKNSIFYTIALPISFPAFTARNCRDRSMITPQNSSGEYTPMGIPQRNGSMGGQSLELLNSAMTQSSMTRNRIPSLSTSTISSVEDDHSPRHGSYYHPSGPPNMPHPEVINPNGGMLGHADIHSYHMKSMGQRPEWSSNVQMGMRQPTFDMYNNSGAFFTPPGYSSTGPVQPNYAAYNSRAPMIPPSGPTYDKMMYTQDSLNRQPPLNYGFQESYPGEPTLRTISHEPNRDPLMHVHPNYLNDRRVPTHIPLQQSTMRDLGDNQFASLFGSSTNKDRGDTMPQDPYTIHDIRAFDSYRAAAAANSNKAHVDLGGNMMNPPQYTFPPNNMIPQSYVDPRSYGNMNGGGFPRQPPQSMVNPNHLYSFADPNIPLMGDGNSLYKLDRPNMIPNREGNLFYDQQPMIVVPDRLMDNLVLMQSSLQISSQATTIGLRDTRQYLDMESSHESQVSSDLSKPLLQQGNVVLSEGKQTDATVYTTSDSLTGKDVSLRIQDNYMTEQAIRVEAQEDGVKIAPSPTASSVRTQDKSYLTVLQSSGTQKDAPIQGTPSTPADHTPPKWKQPVVNPVLPASNSAAVKTEAKYLFNVKFKRATEVFALDNNMVELKPGSFVKVEADRGHDMGTVVSRMPFADYDAESRQSNASERFDKNMLEKSKSQTDCTAPTLKKILRLATPEEITMLQIKQKDEDEILNQCRTKAKQRGLTMNVIDAEYQFDRNKLTFFFQAQGRVDFRDLVKDLFGICKTRIWMQQIDKKPSSSEASG